MPVLLIVSRPSTGEQYWVSIKDYFDDPEHQSSSTVRFHRARNRFCEASYAELVRIGLDDSACLYLGPVPKEETLISNLLPLAAFPEPIWMGASRFSRLEQIWPILRHATRRVGGDWILRGGAVISFCLSSSDTNIRMQSAAPTTRLPRERPAPPISSFRVP